MKKPGKPLRRWRRKRKSERMNRRILCCAVFLLLVSLLGNVSATSAIYWLRGSDVAARFEGTEAYFMSGTPPNASSTGTIVAAEVSGGTHEFGRWYSVAFPQDSIVSNEVFFWVNKLSQGNGNARFRFTLYEFVADSRESREIVQSEWLDFPAGEKEFKAEILEPYAISKGNRLKLALDYNAVEAGGEIRLVLDESTGFGVSVWNVSNNQTYSASGVAGTAALLVNSCTESAIACTTDAYCDDGLALTLDRCENPGSCAAECVAETCTPECTSNAQCDDKSYLTIDVCENSGKCDAACSNNECSVSCSSDTECSDGLPSTLDQCINAGTCFAFCENRVCVGEECDSVARNECGNGLCEFNEACSADCNETTIGLLGVKEGEYFLRGEQIIIEAKPVGFTKVVERVNAEGFFGELELKDNGRSPDKKASDGIYTAAVEIASETMQGVHAVTLTSESASEKAELVKYYVVWPFLEATIDVPLQLSRGGVLRVSGTLNKRGVPLDEQVSLRISSAGKTIESSSVEVNQYGWFFFSYRSSQLDPIGKWGVSVRALDKEGNEALIEKEVIVVSGQASSEITVEVLEPAAGEIERGEELIARVKVLEEGEAVEGAIVKALTPLRETIALKEVAAGVYEGKIFLSFREPLGEQRLIFIVSVSGENEARQAESQQEIVVQPSKLLVGVDVEEESMKAGQNGIARISINYANGEPVENAVVSVEGNGKEFEVRREGHGFVASRQLGADERGTISLVVEAMDSFGNEGKKEVEAEVGAAPLFVFSWGAFLLVLAVLAGIVLAIWASRFVFLSFKGREELVEKEQLLLKEISELQKRYFQKHLMKSKEYYDLMNKYENELNSIRQQLKREKK